MKLLLAEMEKWERRIFEDLNEDHDIVFMDGPLDQKTARKHADAEIISPFIYSKLTADVLNELKKLRFIATRSTGFDHIDMEACRKREIVVANVPTYGKNTVAEHVFGLLLTISHRLYDAVDRTRKGDFSQNGLQGFDLQGKTIGVVGTGEIGLYVMKIANGFGMKVLAFDVKPNQDLHSQARFEYVDMDRLLKKSDVVTLHVPSTKATHHLIDEKEFSKMKKGVTLINTSRGSVVNAEALLRAIADQKVEACGLDVLAEEPLIREEAELMRTLFQKEHKLETLLADHVLLRLKNVFITPHTAFNTREAAARILGTTVGNIQSFLQGKPDNTVGDTANQKKAVHA